MTVLRIAVAMLDLREGEFHRLGIAVLRQKIDDRPARIAQLQQLGDLVEGLAGSVVASVSYVVVGPAVVLALGQVKMGVSAADHQREHGKLQLAIAVSAAPPAAPREYGLPDG